MKAYYHLPGLFEFYELYKVFLPIFCNHRDYFYEFCDIGSIYGAPYDCIWGGGRVGTSQNDAKDVMALMEEYGISARLAFSNSLLKKEHLSDRKCNELCEIFSKNGNTKNGVIIYSDMLLDYIKEHYKGLYFVSTTTKVITDLSELIRELDNENLNFVVPDFRFNNRFELLDKLSEKQKEKVEFLCNECCDVSCADRKSCYENVSRKVLSDECEDHICKSPKAKNGYVFSEAMKSPAFIGVNDIKNIYLKKGFSNFKIEGRSLGSALVFEMLLYYMVKPEYQLRVRELVYLDNSLDIF